jgi:hypothetical protein
MTSTRTTPKRAFFLFITIGYSLWAMNSPAAGQALQQRLQAIYAMSAEEMASTSVFTRRAYEAQLQHIDRIQNPQIREIVRDLVLKPRATAFNRTATQSWPASPGSGWKSHHSYPGGLSVHTMEWVAVASGWVDAYEKIYGVKLDRDLVFAGLILHDWGKLWFLFDDAGGKILEPDWYPMAWGPKRTGNGWAGMEPCSTPNSFPVAYRTSFCFPPPRRISIRIGRSKRTAKASIRRFVKPPTWSRSPRPLLSPKSGWPSGGLSRSSTKPGLSQPWVPRASRSKFSRR